MLIFLDSSAAVKLYSEEEHSLWIRGVLDDHLESVDSQGRHGGIAVASITYVEMRAAFAAKLRDEKFPPKKHDSAVARLREAFRSGYVMRSVPDAAIERAGDLAQAHGLRGYDAVQLAVALSLREELVEAVDRHAEEIGRRRESAREVLSRELWERYYAASEEEKPPAPEEVLVLSFDNELHDAAVAEGIAHERPDRPGGRRFDA